MNRLRTQLIVAFTLVVLITVGAIAWLVVRTTDTQFRQYITHSGMQGSGAGLSQLIAYYEQNGSWEGVESLLQRTIFLGRPAASQMPMPAWRTSMGGTRLDVVLADAGGRVVYDSAGDTEGKRLHRRDLGQALAINAAQGDEVIGYLLLSLPAARDQLGNLEQRFLSQMRRILFLGAGLAVGVGLAIGAIVSRSLTAPLLQLAAGARAVAAGRLGHKVKPEGSDEVVEVAQAFNEMTTALERSERQRTNMVADVAHELRTPLTVLQGNLRAILDGVYPLEATEIARLYDETRLLSRLVDDLRELALADAGQLRLAVRPTDLGEIIRSTVESFAPAAELQEVTLDTPVPPSLPPVQADPDRVGQVLRNLLVNALRHTPAGGTITVKAQAVPAGVQIAVVDSGDGIDPADLPHIFERFWRADRARGRRGGGTGLGLSVARSLIEAQGGRLWAESQPGQGSTFRFTLPAAPGR